MMFLPILLSFVSSVHIFEEFRTLGRGVFADDKVLHHTKREIVPSSVSK